MFLLRSIPDFHLLQGLALERVFPTIRVGLLISMNKKIGNPASQLTQKVPH